MCDPPLNELTRCPGLILAAEQEQLGSWAA